MEDRIVRGACVWLATLALLCASHTMAQQAGATGNLNGTWVIPSNHYNPIDRKAFPESQWSTERLPFTPSGRAAFEANKPGRGPRRVTPAQVNDPQNGANPNGLYRTLMYSRPFEFVQAQGKVVQLFGWGLVWRTIYVDGRPVPDEVAAGPFWLGHSVGHWEGQTLVVNTLALDERAWFDEWGTPISADARIEERWQRIAPDKLQLQVTVRDPAFYTRPWTSTPLVYALQKGDGPQEIIFAPMDMQSFDETLREPSMPRTP